MDIDPNYKPQPKYPSGNEGRRHPSLKHDGYFQETRTRLRTDPQLLERLRKFIDQT